MLAVTLIGAGSTVFAGELVTDFLLTEPLQGGEFRLVDTDSDRLGLAHRFAEHLVEGQVSTPTIGLVGGPKTTIC